MPITTRLRLALVVPRYLPEMVGGAEALLQGYAERLAQAGHAAEVLTTCTTRLDNWNNDLAPGEDRLRGVPVRRFSVDHGDRQRFWRLANELAQTGRLSYRDQLELLRNSLNSTALCEYLRAAAGQYDAVIIGPYAFGLAFGAARAAAGRAVWVPCLHDEPLAHCAVVREALEEARGILFNTAAEARFAREQLGLINPAGAVVGQGFAADTPAGDAARFRAAHGLSGPFVLYAGRMIPEKNTPELLALFARYRESLAPDLSLVLVGDGASLPPQRDGVRALGFLPADELRDAYAAAHLLCQPSLNESFSIVLMESWLQGRPVLVHAGCAATREHVEQSGGGWAFTDFDSFAAAVSAALGQPEQADARGQRGRGYVLERYAWPAVLDRLTAALAGFLAPRALPQELAQRGIRRALEFTRERYDARFGTLLDEVLPPEQRVSADTLLAPLRMRAPVGLPGYQPASAAPLVGRLIARVRRALTSHLKEPYVDLIVQRQEEFNVDLVERLQRALEHAYRRQYQLERQVRRLEAQVRGLHQQADSSEEPSS